MAESTSSSLPLTQVAVLRTSSIPRPRLIEDIIASRTLRPADAASSISRAFNNLIILAMETDGVHENMMSSELRYVLLQTFTAIDDLIHRAEGQEPEEADNIINFFSRDSVAHFKPDGPDAVEYKATPTQECVRQWRQSHGPPKLPTATGTTSHISNGIYKPDFFIYVKHSTGASRSQAMAMLGEHKSDTALNAAARTRQCFAQHLVQLASAYEALHTPLGYALVKTRYSRVLVLGPGTFAVEQCSPNAGQDVDQPLRRSPRLAANNPGVFRAIDFLRRTNLFVSLAHDLHPRGHESRYAGLQALWDLALASLDILSPLPCDRPLPKLPVPAGRNIGDTFDRIVAASTSTGDCVQNRDTDGHITDLANDSVQDKVSTSPTSGVDDRKQGNTGCHDDDDLDDLVPFDCDAESYAEELLFTRVINEQKFTVVTVTPSEMDAMIKEYVAFVLAELRRTSATTTPELSSSTVSLAE